MPDFPRLSRKEFLLSSITAFALARRGIAQTAPGVPEISAEDLKAFEEIAGLQFTEAERSSILGAIRQGRRGFEDVRALNLDDQIAPPTPFRPPGRTPKPGHEVALRPTPVRGLRKPAKDEDIAFLSVRELGQLLRARQITSEQLTRIYLDRLKAHGENLLCLVTLTEDLALRQAKSADEEIRRGRFRGPLHGIPYGLKDLFAVPRYPTTWGSEPHRSQRLEVESAVFERLTQAGAVLVAKLSMGALAQGDVWFKGRTKNPWNPQQGSSGSSAGSACATAAGLVGFAIGTETLGSIMSPSHQCRVSGLRPTFGRVSRYGAMCLSYTMDKVGPICRTVEDCALVFSALTGEDSRDDATRAFPFSWRHDLDLRRLKIAYLISANDDPNDAKRLESDAYLKGLVERGCKLVPAKFSPVPNGVNVVLRVEAAAAFDAFTRGDRIDELKNSSWPETFRSSRYVSAVEYLAAQRARRAVSEKFEEELGDFDAVVANERGGNLLFITNLTGHPQVLIPLPRAENGAPRSCSVIGRLFEEEKALAIAHAIQLKSGSVEERPSSW